MALITGSILSAIFLTMPDLGYGTSSKYGNYISRGNRILIAKEVVATMLPRHAKN
jgi:hypothetical protein